MIISFINLLPSWWLSTDLWREKKPEISSLEMSCDHSLGCSQLLCSAHGSSSELCDASPARLPWWLHTANPSSSWKCLWQSLESCHGAAALSRYHRRHSLLTCSLSCGNMINLIISESAHCGKWWRAIWLWENGSNVSVWCKKCFWMGEWIMYYDSQLNTNLRENPFYGDYLGCFYIL